MFHLLLGGFKNIEIKDRAERRKSSHKALALQIIRILCVFHIAEDTKYYLILDVCSFLRYALLR